MLFRMSFVFLVICFVCYPSIHCEEQRNDSSKEQNVFVPTNTWKTVKKGQPIPQGLHVRMNINTGETEAKLLTKTESKTSAVIPVDDPDKKENESVNTAKVLTSKEVKEALKNIEAGYTEEVVTEKDVERARQKYRSYDELKKEFQELNLLVKTDMEIMNDLFNRFRAKPFLAAANEEENLAILKDFEYLVHQYDNAQEFVKSGGLTDIVYPCLNATSPRLRSEAVRLMGAAAQSNPKVQIAALESGGLSLLLRSLALDSDHSVRAGALHAISCLTRRFPAAQARLLSGGGLDVLAGLFGSDSEDSFKLQVKAVTLLYDLLKERQEAEEMGAQGALSDEEVERLRQYRVVGLESRLAEQGWCQRLVGLLSAQQGSAGASPSDDTVEKVAGAMQVLSDACKDEFRASGTINTLAKLGKWYLNLAMQEEEEGYHLELAQLLRDLKQRIEGQNTPRDEL